MDAPRGAHIQLFALGASDVFLCGNTSSPYCYNSRQAMMHWFVDRDDGNATCEDVWDVHDMPGILEHLPEMLRPALSDVTASFSIKKERSCVKIQRAWRNCISNPRQLMCKKRLEKEFCELAGM